jgi:hypothetical protein
MDMNAINMALPNRVNIKYLLPKNSKSPMGKYFDRKYINPKKITKMRSGGSFNFIVYQNFSK